jgi:hypothetical protein
LRLIRITIDTSGEIGKDSQYFLKECNVGLVCSFGHECSRNKQIPPLHDEARLLWSLSFH